jgi:hypothetical protein
MQVRCLDRLGGFGVEVYGCEGGHAGLIHVDAVSVEEGLDEAGAVVAQHTKVEGVIEV